MIYHKFQASMRLLLYPPMQSVWDQFEALKRQDCGGVSQEAFLRDLIYVLQGLEICCFSVKVKVDYVVNGRIRVARPYSLLGRKIG